MPSGWSFSVTYLATSVDISEHVNDLLLTVTGSGEISSAVILFNSLNGRFITQANGGATPILDQFDQLLVELNDGQGNGFFKILEVDKLRPIEGNPTGTQLRVEMLARERHVQYVNLARQYYFMSAFDVLKNMADRYNTSKGSTQPSITLQDDITFNELPKWTANHYDFNFAEIPIYEGMSQVIDKLGASVSAGGAADFYELYFDDVTGTYNSNLRIKAFSAGSKPPSPITITSSLAVNIGESEAQIESITGTNVCAWGANDQGSMPTDFSKFRGIKEAFLLYPYHISGQTYPANAIVQLSTGAVQRVYRTSAQTSATPPSAPWTQIFEYTLLGNNSITTYSPWTVNRANQWINSGCDQNGVGRFGRGCWDSNLVVFDGQYYRTWVDTKQFNSASIPSSHKILDNGGPPAPRLYRGYRVLVTGGTAAGDFATNSARDRFGNSYQDAIVEHNGGRNTGANAYLNWDCLVTKTNPPNGQAILLGTGNQCAILDRGENWLWGGAVWADDSGTAIGNDCFHPFTSLTVDSGVDQTATSGGGKYGDNSAIKFTYEYNPAVLNPIAPIRTDNNYYKCGVWANIRFPYPVTNDNGPSVNVGSLYGPYLKDAADMEPVTVDAFNMNYTPAGNTGFNATDSDSLGAISAIAFTNKFRWTLSNGFTFTDRLAGNFKMRCAVFDTAGNVAVQDFTISFNNMWEDIMLPLDGFKIYRARTPLRWGAIQTVIPIPQLNILNVFQWRYIKQICIQLQEVYDSEGRYAPETTRFVIETLQFPQLGNARIEYWIDSFRFVKPLFATSGTVADRNLEPVFLQRPLIANYYQLKNDAIAMKDIFGFRHKQYDITTSGTCDISFGDSFYYYNPRIISDSDNGANTIKLVAKKIVYHVNKVLGGPGGFTRTITGVRRYPLI